jgi:hypothetical protein
LAVVLILMASGAQAATLNVVGGQLHGAFGVDVGGTLYDKDPFYALGHGGYRLERDAGALESRLGSRNV